VPAVSEIPKSNHNAGQVRCGAEYKVFWGNRLDIVTVVDEASENEVVMVKTAFPFKDGSDHRRRDLSASCPDQILKPGELVYELAQGCPVLRMLAEPRGASLPHCRASNLRKGDRNCACGNRAAH
tara:strand:- start:2088 stop:2462 length:375 start_codon:yes stop_codon:yes gene_type:complete